MTDHIRHARRFVLHHPHQPDTHGIEFPSGLCLYDQPGTGLEAATSIEHVRGVDDATIHWADETATQATDTTKEQP